MLLEQWEFTLDSGDEWEAGMWKHADFTVCSYRLNQLFHVPLGVKTIWLGLHTSPASQRVPVRIVLRSGNMPHPPFPSVIVPKDQFVPALVSDEKMENGDLDDILMPFVDKTLYLQCEYE